MRGVAVRAPAYNPWALPTVSSLIHGVWLSDPAWRPPPNGSPIDSLLNRGRGGDPASTGAGRPTYRSSTAAFNNRPTAEFLGAQRLDVDVTDSGLFCMVVVGSTAGANGVLEQLVGFGGAGSQGFGDTAANQWSLNAGSALNAGACDSSPHVFWAAKVGAFSGVRVDSDSVAGPTGDPGAGSLTRLTIGAGSDATPTFTNFLTGHIGFYGVYNIAASLEVLAMVPALKRFYAIP